MPSIAELIEQHREALLQRYLEEARRLPSARELPPQDVLGNLPELLDALIALSRGQPGEPAGQRLRRLEDAHLGLRLRQGYTPRDVTAELVLLGRLLSRLWEPLPPAQQPTPEDLQRLFDALQSALEHAVSVFTGISGLSEERLHLAVEATGMGTWDLDPTTGTLHWDERCKALFGLPPEASVDYATYLTLLHPEDRDRVRERVQRSLEPSGSGTFRDEYRVLRARDGSVGWVAATGRAFFDEQGRAVRLIGTALDITGRVRERAAAEREKHRVTTILESISEAFDADWRFTYVNREAERLLGQPREALLGRGQWDVFPATVGTRLEHEFRRVATERVPRSFEDHDPQSDRWFDIHAYPTEEGIAVYFRDISERKRREAERERLLLEQTRLRELAEKAVRAQQRTLEVLEHGEAFFLLDKDFRFVLVNENQERLSRTRREDTLGRVFWDVFPTTASPGSRYWREYHRVVEQQVPVQFEEYYAPLELWTSVSAFPTSEGGIAVFFRDSTAHQRAEQFRERLVGIVSHDLRSPLQSISLATELLLHRDDVPGHVLAGVRRIARSADRMARMITDLLDFTRARLGGGIPVQRRPGELAELVRTTLEEFEVTHPGRVVFSPGRGPYTGQWDPDRLAQVVSNLVGNALRHGDPHTPVRVSLGREGKALVLSVTNQGPPIPEELLPHIFDPFRGAADSAREGLGLGLYIVQQIVVAHGGTLSVHSTGAEGTTFTVRFF